MDQGNVMVDRLRLGLATFLRPEMDIWGWVKLAAELSLGAVELRADPGMAHPDELSSPDRKRLRTALREAGLRATVHVPIHDLNLASPNKRAASVALAELVASVNLAADLGAELLVFHPGSLPMEYVKLPGEYDRSWQRLLFALALVVPHAASHGVRMTIENKHKGNGQDLVLTPEDHHRALDRFPELGACLDFGHLHTLGGDPLAYAMALGDKLWHVHLHDNHGERDEHLPLGEGNLDFMGVLSALIAVGYRGLVILEIPDPAGLRRSVDQVTR